MANKGKLSTKLRTLSKKPGIRVSIKILSVILKCLLTIFLIGVITGSIVVCVMVVYVATKFDGSQGIPDLDKIRQNETSIMYIQKNDQWEEFLRLEGTNSIWTDIKDIPVHMQNAVIAIEDERFHEHYGVDWKRTVAAFANMIFHFDSREFGGSTITQQLIKTVTQEKDHKVERKITEIMRAIYMEQNIYDKDEILEAYLNVLPLSGNVVGVGAAANYYFDKDLQDLSLAECAAIASITQNPAKYNPYSHPENLRRRQETVLYKMHELGMISTDEYIQAANEELRFKNGFKRVAVQDYYTDMVIEDVISALMEQKGYSYTYAEQMIYYGGLRIYSYEDPVKQKKIEEIYADDSNFPAKLEGDNQDPQAAIFIMDYQGRVVATAGGRGKKTQNRIQNRATMSVRQPGSAIKPIATFAPAISLNLVHYSTMIPDEPIILPNGKAWPPNFGKSVQYNPPVTVTTGLERSLNTVAIQVLKQVTVDYSYEFLSGNLKISTLEKQDRDWAPLGLGGFTHGVKCNEMAAAFAIFGNGGLRYAPMSFEKVTDKNGDILVSNINEPIRALDSDSAYVVNRLTQKVIKGSRGTASSIAKNWNGWEVFGKTGTSGLAGSGTYNVYFVGGTPEYVAASWFGYDYNKELRSSQTRTALNLWNKSMLALRNNSLQDKTFNHLKGNTVEAKFCTQTGMLVGPGNTCPSTDMGVYKPDFMPGYCEVHGGGGTTTESTDPATVPPAATTAATTATTAVAAP